MTSFYMNWSLGLAVIGAATAFVLRVMIALAVYRSASHRETTVGSSLRFFGPKAWAFAGLVGGLLAMAVYQVMHYSTFAKEAEKE